MKRTFCDVCGQEMTYDDKESTTSRGGRVTGLTHESRKMELNITINISPVNAPNGGHTDVCGGCRWAAIDQLDPRPRVIPPTIESGPVQPKINLHDIPRRPKS